MYVIADARKATPFVRTLLGFEELLEAIASQLLILDMVGLVFFCSGQRF